CSDCAEDMLQEYALAKGAESRLAVEASGRKSCCASASRARVRVMNELAHPRAIPGALVERIKAVVGPKGWSDDAMDVARTRVDWRQRYRGRTALLVRPATTSETAEVVRLCAEARVPIVPQGGNTSLCGGSIPSESGDEILLSLSRLNRVRAIDSANYTITAETR